MLISHNREKLLNSIVFFLKNTKNCGITKLMKLLFFLDFLHFRETGKTVTGMDYFAWDFGPVPQELYSDLKKNKKEMPRDLAETIRIVQYPNDENAKIVPIKNFKDQFFSEREMKLLKKIAFIFKDALAKDMTEITHLKNTPWERTKNIKGLKERIDYLLALDDSPESLTEEVVLERMEELAEMQDLFNYEKRNSSSSPTV